MDSTSEIKRAYNEYIELIAIILNQEKIASDYLAGLGFALDKKEIKDLEHEVTRKAVKEGKKISKAVRELAGPIRQAKEEIRAYLTEPERDEEFFGYACRVIEHNYSEQEISEAIDEIEKFDVENPLYDPFKLGMKKDRNPLTLVFFEMLKLHGIRRVESPEEKAKRDVEKSFDILEAGGEITDDPEVTILEEELPVTFEKIGLKKKYRLSIMTYLNLIKLRDIDIWKHSIRTGLTGIRAISSFADPRAIFCAGVLHDIGKVLPDLVHSERNLNEKDRLKKDLMKSYLLVGKSHAFSASIIQKYYKYISEGGLRFYSESQSDGPAVDFSKKSRKLIDFYAALLKMIDNYDDLTHAVGTSSDGDVSIDRDVIKQAMLAQNPGQELFIEDLFDKEIF